MHIMTMQQQDTLDVLQPMSLSVGITGGQAWEKQ